MAEHDLGGIFPKGEKFSSTIPGLFAAGDALCTAGVGLLGSGSVFKSRQRDKRYSARWVATCHLDVLRLDEESGTPTITYPEECQICRLCSKYCPEDGTITITYDKYKPPMVGWR